MEIHRPINTKENGVTPRPLPTSEGEKIPEDLFSFYKTKIFNTDEKKGQLAYIAPILKTLDTLSPNLENKRSVLSYIHWTVSEASWTSYYNTLGITGEEYTEHIGSVVNPHHPEQGNNEELFIKFERLSGEERTEFVKELLLAGWKVADITTMLSIDGGYVSSVKKRLSGSPPTQSSSKTQS